MKIKKWISIGVVIFTFGLTLPAWSWIYVPPLGDTGWRTFSYQFEVDFIGYAGFVVSNQGDDIIQSELLIDKLSHGTNQSFETGDYTGYSLIGMSIGEVVTGPVTAPSLFEYYPTDGSYMSYQLSYYKDTSIFTNAFGQPGTIGSILETLSPINFKGGESFTFNWAFITWDEPIGDVGYDFALFYLKNTNGDIVETRGLAQVVPIPTTLILLGSGLLGLAGIKLRRRGKL